MHVTRHAEKKVRVIRTVVTPADLKKLENAITAKAQSSDSFDVTVPLSKPVFDQFHGNLEYRRNLKAVVKERSLVTVYFV